MRLLATIALLSLLCGVRPACLRAQEGPTDDSSGVAGQRPATRLPVPELRTRWQALEGDSMRIVYAVPEAPGRPAVIVLGDRYGLRENVRSTVKVLATLGFRAYALPLRSAPERPFDAVPAAVFDSTDIARVTRAAVDIANEAGCDGRLFLLGYDVGANVAMEVIARFPFYEGAVLFYPVGDAPVLERLLDAQCRFQLHVAQHDAQCALGEVNLVREKAIERRMRMHVLYYRDVRRFFCNPEHPDYDKASTQKAWNQINKFFRYP